MKEQVKKTGFMKKRRQDLLFYIAFMAFPVIQFIVFYVVKNFNSFVLAFQGYDAFQGYYFNGLENFKKVFYDIAHEYYFKTGIRNSLIHYGIGLVIGLPLGLTFSYYIYKKFLMSEIFKVILFLPSVVSIVVMQIIWANVMDGMIPEIYFAKTGNTMLGLMANSKTRFLYLELFNIWVSFGGSMLYYVGAMARIPDSLIEAAELDGASLWEEFFQVVIPLTWSTVKTLLVVGIAGIFTADLNLYLFYGTGAETDAYIVGYNLLRLTVTSKLDGYPYISAFGMILTAVTMILTFAMRFVLEKYTWEDVEF
ncbi:MAG: sugar ABC transporter permease [Clostridia bacterium]|nr:sugar ABC transporter permease [Clostridia bacterium]